MYSCELFNDVCSALQNAALPHNDIADTVSKVESSFSSCWESLEITVNMSFCDLILTVGVESYLSLYSVVILGLLPGDL